MANKRDTKAKALLGEVGGEEGWKGWKGGEGMVWFCGVIEEFCSLCRWIFSVLLAAFADS